MTPSTPATPLVVESIAALRVALAEKGSVAFVPTMGALHEGHMSLVSHAASVADTVVVSIFVNPLQFTQPEDLERYPRTIDADVATIEATGIPVIIFAPSVDELYPAWPIETKVVAGPVGSMFEGASRPGHFDGVLTIVAKLIGIVRPDTIVFGQKDAQQVFLVKRMVADLNLPVRVDVAPTVREPDGLALSSRNRFLDPKHKHAALTLSHALEAAESSADLGIDGALAAAQGVLMGESLVQLDYLKVVVPTTFLPVNDGYTGKAIVIVAAVVGGVRLIDNVEIHLGG